MVNSSFQVVSKLPVIFFENEVDKIGHAGCYPQKLEKEITRLGLMVKFFWSAMRNNFGQQVNNDITEIAPDQRDD